MSNLENEAAQSTNALGPLVGLAREDLMGAVAMLLRETASDPARSLRHAQGMGADMVKIMTGQSDLAPDAKDKRFMDPAWQHNPFLKAGAQYYLAVQKGMQGWIADLELDELERDRANFITNIIIDGMAPTNTLMGNPAAQKRAIDSGGMSLIKGLKNAYDDIVNNKGMVSQVDKKPFTLGENIATSKGSVVLRTEMMELVHYAPVTDEVYEIPAADDPAADQQDVHQRSQPRQIGRQMAARQRYPAIRHILAQPDEGTGPLGHGRLYRVLPGSDGSSIGHYRIEEGQRIRRLFGRADGGHAGKQAGGGRRCDLIGALTLMVCVLHPKQNDIEAGSLISENGLKLAKRRAAKQGVITGDSLCRAGSPGCGPTI